MARSEWGGEVNHNAVRIDVAPHAGDYLNLAPQLRQKTWNGESFRQRISEEGRGGWSRPTEVHPGSAGTGRSDLLEHAG